MPDDIDKANNLAQVATDASVAALRLPAVPGIATFAASGQAAWCAAPAPHAATS